MRIEGASLFYGPDCIPIKNNVGFFFFFCQMYTKSRITVFNRVFKDMHISFKSTSVYMKYLRLQIGYLET